MCFNKKVASVGNVILLTIMIIIMTMMIAVGLYIGLLTPESFIFYYSACQGVLCGFDGNSAKYNLLLV